MAEERNGVVLLEDVERNGQIAVTGWRVFFWLSGGQDDMREALIKAEFKAESKELTERRVGAYAQPFHVEQPTAWGVRPYYYLPNKSQDETSEALLSAGFSVCFP